MCSFILNMRMKFYLKCVIYYVLFGSYYFSLLFLAALVRLGKEPPLPHHPKSQIHLLQSRCVWFEELITILGNSISSSVDSHDDIYPQICRETMHILQGNKTPLMAQWMGFHRPVLMTQAWSLAREESTGRGAMKPALQPLSPPAQSLRSTTREATTRRSLSAAVESSPHWLQLEKAHTAVKTQHHRR